jgi:hypothetical protein
LGLVYFSHLVPLPMLRRSSPPEGLSMIIDS